MKRTSIRLTTWLSAILAILSACAFAQDFTQNPKSPSPDELPGQQLIVWTATQKPQPIPVTSPETDQASTEQASTNQGSSQTQVLTGTILAQGSDLLFAASGADYQIDNKNQEGLRAFNGKQIQISGSVDPYVRSVHVVSIESR
jgi:uncharacterized protein YdeI (BOF family)